MSPKINSLPPAALPGVGIAPAGVVATPAAAAPAQPRGAERPTQRPSRLLRRAALAAGIALVTTSAGCAMVGNARKALTKTECIDDFIANHRNEVMAQKAWYRVESCYQNHCCVKDFKAGFIAGYMEVADGGSGCTPTVVDSSYWGWRHRGPEGQNCINAWFEGFPMGAKAAEQDGVGFHNMIRVEGPPPCGSVPMMTGSMAPTPAGVGPDGLPLPPGVPGAYPVPGAAPLSGVPADPILDAPAGAAVEAPPGVFRDRTDRPVPPRSPSVLPDGIDADLPYSATPFTPPPAPPRAPGYGPLGAAKPIEPLPPGIRLQQGERIVPEATTYREVDIQEDTSAVSISSPSDRVQPASGAASPATKKAAKPTAAAASGDVDGDTAGMPLPAWLRQSAGPAPAGPTSAEPTSAGPTSNAPAVRPPTPSVMSFTDQSAPGPSARVATAPAKVQVRLAEPPSGLSPTMTLPPPASSRPLDAQPSQAEIDAVIAEIFGRSNP